MIKTMLTTPLTIVGLMVSLGLYSGQASALDQVPVAGTTPAVGFRGDGSGLYPDVKFTATWTPATKPV